MGYIRLQFIQEINKCQSQLHTKQPNYYIWIQCVLQSGTFLPLLLPLIPNSREKHFKRIRIKSNRNEVFVF